MHNRQVWKEDDPCASCGKEGGVPILLIKLTKGRGALDLFVYLFNTIMKLKVAQSCLTLRPQGLYSPWDSPGQNTGVGSLSLLHGIFSTQGSTNPGLPHCRQILYQLSQQGTPSWEHVKIFCYV